jgi:hypothetical protein
MKSQRRHQGGRSTRQTKHNARSHIVKESTGAAIVDPAVGRHVVSNGEAKSRNNIHSPFYLFIFLLFFALRFDRFLLQRFDFILVSVEFKDDLERRNMVLRRSLQ